jgi:ABC-type spermidine/putrescine transport system permease subunit I
VTASADPAPQAEAHAGAARRRLGRLLPFGPGAVVFGLLFFAPLAIVFVYSFWQTNNNFQVVADWTTRNYTQIFTTPTYLRTFGKTLLMAALVTATGLATAGPFAYFLVRYVSPRIQRIVLLAVIVPFWTSYLVRIYAWQAILGEKGALNGLLLQLHVISEPLTVFLYNDVGVFIVLLYVYFPFAALALYTALEKFDFTQLTAAQDLGARPDQALRRILLPQIRAGIITACVFVFIPILGEYLTPTLVGGTQGVLIGNLIVNFYRGGLIPQMAAAAFLIAGVVLILLVVFRKYLQIADVVTRV